MAINEQLEKISIKNKIWFFLKTNKYLLGIFLVAAILRFWGLMDPVGKPWETGFQAYIAKNHYLYGLSVNHFVNVIGYDSAGPIFHLTHPPLLQIIVYCFYLIFGVYDWVAKLVPIIFSLGSLSLLYFLVKKVWGNKKMALYASFIFAVIPMASYFGKVVNYEVPTLFFSLLYLYSYLSLDKKNARWPMIFLFVSAFCGSLLDWPFYIMVAGVFLHSLLMKRRRKIILLSSAFSMLIFSVFFYHINSLGLTLKNATVHAKHRGNLSVVFDPEFYKIVVSRFYSYFNLVGLGVFISFLYFAFKKQIRRNIQNLDIILLLLFQPVVYSLAFLQSVSVHVWHLYYFVAAFSILGALIIVKLQEKTNFWYKPVVVLFLIIFSVQSFCALYKINVLSYESQYHKLAEFLNDNMEDDEFVYLLGYSQPEFYLKSSQPCHMLRGPSFECVDMMKPKFIVFPNIVTQDASWDRVAFEEELVTDYGYNKIFDNPVIMSNDIKINSNYIKFEDMYVTSEKDFVSKESYASFITSSLSPIKEDGDIVFSFYQHPNIEDKYYLNYSIIPQNNEYLSFSIGISDRVYNLWSGNGVVFEIYIENNDETNKVFSKYLNPQKNKQDQGWHDFEIDLSEYAGQEITIKFLTLPGPNNNYNYDWAYWGDPRIENKKYY